MHVRTYLSGFTVLVLSLAALTGSGQAASSRLPSLADHSPVTAVPNRHGAAVILAQASDPRLISLEEEVRRLNGRVEELNFQILQMQDQLRRMQEDNEFRFQELEGKRSDAGDGTTTPGTGQAASPPANSGGTAGVPGDVAPTVGAPPRTLGTITFDENGNVVTSPPGEPIDLLQGGQIQGSDNSVVAALPPSDNPDEIYRNAYEFVLSGDYRTAESGFRQYLERFPEGEHAADANFWLGEALLGQDRYREAAEVFLQANRDYPDAKKAPEMLLKLGVSLAALDQIDVACATFTEVGQRYPQVSEALRQRVRQEQASAGC